MWLTFPVAGTAGIPGLLPLVQDLPLIFEDSPNKQAREKGIFKNAKGILRGWKLDPKEEKRLADEAKK